MDRTIVQLTRRVTIDTWRGLQHQLVPALHPALPQAVGQCCRLAVHPALRTDHADLLPDHRRQGPGAPELLDAGDDRAGMRYSASSMSAAVSAQLRAVAHHQPHRCRARSRLFDHLLRLPLAISRPAAGQTVRACGSSRPSHFLTGQGCPRRSTSCSASSSWRCCSSIRSCSPSSSSVDPVLHHRRDLPAPPLRNKIKERFNRGAASNQFLVEAVVGAQTVKAPPSSRSCAPSGRAPRRLRQDLLRGRDAVRLRQNATNTSTSSPPRSCSISARRR